MNTRFLLIAPRAKFRDVPDMPDRSRWTIRKFSSFEEQRCEQIRQWQSVSGAERRKAAWELVTDYWIDKKGAHPDELRLQRSTSHLRRGAG